MRVFGFTAVDGDFSCRRFSRCPAVLGLPPPVKMVQLGPAGGAVGSLSKSRGAPAVCWGLAHPLCGCPHTSPWDGVCLGVCPSIWLPMQVERLSGTLPAPGCGDAASIYTKAAFVLDVCNTGHYEKQKIKRKLRLLFCMRLKFHC